MNIVVMKLRELIKNVDDLQNKSRRIKDIYSSCFPLSFVLNIRYYIIRYVNSWPSNQINKQYPDNLFLPRRRSQFLIKNLRYKLFQETDNGKWDLKTGHKYCFQMIFHFHIDKMPT